MTAVSLGLTKAQYVAFVKAMVESAVNNPAGGNYRLDNILTTFRARDINGDPILTDFSPINNYLQWNADFGAGYTAPLATIPNYTRKTRTGGQTALECDMREALTSPTCFFAVLVFGQVPIQDILNIYYPNNTYTEFVQCVVYAGTKSTPPPSYINSAINTSDGYGAGLASGVDPTAFNPYQYNLGNLRFNIDNLPDRISIIDMWAAASPSQWNGWLNSSTTPVKTAAENFLGFIQLAFQFHVNEGTDTADLIRELASMGPWDSTNPDNPPGFASEFAHWQTGGYNASWLLSTNGTPSSIVQFGALGGGVYNFSDTYGIYTLSDFAETDNQYSYSNVVYDLVVTPPGGVKTFNIIVPTLLAANVSIDQILNAYPTETAPSFFYKGYMTAGFARRLYYIEGKISFSTLIANGDQATLQNNVIPNPNTAPAGFLGKDFKTSTYDGTASTTLTKLDPYVLLYEHVDFVPETSGPIYDAWMNPDTKTKTIYDYTLSAIPTFTNYPGPTGSLIDDMAAAVFKTISQSTGLQVIDTTVNNTPNKVVQLIYNHLYRTDLIRGAVVASNASPYTFVTDTDIDATDAKGNPATAFSLDRGTKIRLDELRSVVGYTAAQLADSGSTFLTGTGPFTVNDFTAENYSTKNTTNDISPSMYLFDVFSVYGYTVSQIYNAVLKYHRYNATSSNASETEIKTALIEMSASRGNNVSTASATANLNRFTDFDLVYYLGEATNLPLGYDESAAISTADEDILNVTLTGAQLPGINNTTTIALSGGTGSAAGRYSNFADGNYPISYLKRGSTYTMSVQVGTTGFYYTNAVAVFIDYDRNGSFSTPSETAFRMTNTVSGPHTQTFTITIPLTARLGKTLMRVVCSEDLPNNIYPTGIYNWGETEDYIVHIIDDSINDSDSETDISSITKFFPALSYDRIRATYFANNNTTAITSATALNCAIHIDTLTDNGDTLAFLSASDTNDVSGKINNANVSHSNANPYTNTSRYGTIYDILTMITSFSTYTPTDIAYYVLTLPKVALVSASSNPVLTSSSSIANLIQAVTNATKLRPIDLLVPPQSGANGSAAAGTYSKFTKVELNGLYATDTQPESGVGTVNEIRGTPGKNTATWSRLAINTFLPTATDYTYLLYGTNIGPTSMAPNYGIRGILSQIDAYSAYNTTNIAYLCLSLEVSSTISTLVVPHDIGPNGTIKQTVPTIFTRDEIRRLTFTDGTDDLQGPAVKKTPAQLVTISSWDTQAAGKTVYYGADYVYDKDYSLLNVTDTFVYDSNLQPIKYILNTINNFGTTTADATLYKNIAIALNNIYMASTNLVDPRPVDLFDGGYYTRDEIRTLFLQSPADSTYQLTLSTLTSGLSVTTDYALYKLAYATDASANGTYTMNSVLTTGSIGASDAERAQIIRKMMYSVDYQTAIEKYHVQPWQLVNTFAISGNVVRELAAVSYTVYTTYNTPVTNASLTKVETVLINLYKNPNYYTYTEFSDQIDATSLSIFKLPYEYTLYKLNVDFGYNKSNEASLGTYYLKRIIGANLFLDPAVLSPRRIAIELRLGAQHTTDNTYSTYVTTGSYTFGDVVDALNTAGDYSSATYSFSPSTTEMQNKNIYITDFATSPQSSSYPNKAGTATITDSSILYHSNTAVAMWQESDWIIYLIYIKQKTGQQLIIDYGFTTTDVRHYFFNINYPNGTLYDTIGDENGPFPTTQFLTDGTYMTDLLFARDVNFSTPTADPVTLLLLQELYTNTNGTFYNAVNAYNTGSLVENIMRYVYYTTTGDAQIRAQYGSTRSSTLKDIEFMLMGTISNSDTHTVNSGFDPVSFANIATMKDAFPIDVFYTEVITYNSSSKSFVMNVNDFYHYWTRIDLHDYTVRDAAVTLYVSGRYPASIKAVVDTYGPGSVASSITANTQVNFQMTIDYFTLNELAIDENRGNLNQITLGRIARDYYGKNTADLDGIITLFNVRHPTGLELYNAGLTRNATWSPLNIRKLYYTIDNTNEFRHATGFATTQYITFQNLVGAVNGVTVNATVNTDKGDYSFVYAQDYGLKADMYALFGSTTTSYSAAAFLLHEGSPEYKSLTGTLPTGHSGKPLGYVYKTTDSAIDTTLDSRGRLYYDEIRTIVGIAGTDIKVVFDATVIVPEADASPSRIYTTATNNYWVSATAYDTKWMTLKYAYAFSAAEIAQNSTTVIGTDLLNVSTHVNNLGFTANETRIGFFYNLRYFTGGNSGPSANHQADTSNAGFTKYLSDPEFTTGSIAKFSQMVNKGETSSLTAVDKDSAYLIPAYSTTELLTGTPNNVIFYNLFKYLRALYNARTTLSLPTTSGYLLYYMDKTNSNSGSFLYDLNNLDPNNSGNTDLYYTSNQTSYENELANTYIKIVMYVRFQLNQNTIYINNFYSSYLKTALISIIHDYYFTPTDNRVSYQLIYLQNLFSAADIQSIQTVPALWNGGDGVSVKSLVENYEAAGRSTDYIFAALYPYIPLELLLAYRTYNGTPSSVTRDSGQQSSTSGTANQNGVSGYYYYNDPLNSGSRYATGSRWISVATALRGMDGKWGTSWNDTGLYYTDRNADAPSIDQILTALSIIDGNSISTNTNKSLGIDTTLSSNYSYSTLTAASPVIAEIRNAFLLTDGTHPAICGYNTNTTYPTVFPSTTTAGGPGTNTDGSSTTAPTINQLVALINGQNIPLGFAKLLFAPTALIRSSIYTRAEKRGLFAVNNSDGGLADAYYQLKLLSISESYLSTLTIAALANAPSSPNNTGLLPLYYTSDHVISDLISLKFSITAYNNFNYNTSIGTSADKGYTTSTLFPALGGRVIIPSPSLLTNPFTTYGLLTAYDNHTQGYDNDGYLISVQGQLIWHTTAERTIIIDTIETSSASEYKYNPDFDNTLVNNNPTNPSNIGNSGNTVDGPYGKDSTGYYYYAYPENLSTIQDVYRIEQRALYKADTRAGRGMSSDPNLNILVALKAIGVPATIALKFPATAYSPFTNKNIGGVLDQYTYTRGTNTQNSITSTTYDPGNTPNQRLLNFTAYDLLSAFTAGSVESDANGYVFNNMDRLLWHTVQERDEIIEAFSNTTTNNGITTTTNMLMYNPTTSLYGKDSTGHYYFAYPENLNDFGDLAGNRPTP